MHSPDGDPKGQPWEAVQAIDLISQAPKMISVTQRPLRPDELVAVLKELSTASADPVVAQALSLSQTFCKSKDGSGDVRLENVSFGDRRMGLLLAAYIPNGTKTEVRTLAFTVPEHGKVSMALGGDRWQLNGGKRCSQAFEDLERPERVRFVAAMMTALGKAAGV